MLTGTIKSTINGNKYVYYAKANDISSSMSIKLATTDLKSVGWMRADGDDDLGLWERRLNVGLSKVTVETIVKVNPETNKKVKEELNNDWFAKLGAIIRYMKNNCKKENEEGYTGLTTYSSTFIPETETTYIIPIDKKNPSDTQEYLGKVTLCLGEIKALEINSPYFEIKLKEDKSAEQEVFDKITDGRQIGFKFDYDTLGIYMKPQVIVNVNTVNGIYATLDDVIKAHPDKEFEWLRSQDFKIVDDEHLDEICDYIYNHDGYVYYDTETSGLDINFKSRTGQADQLVGVVLSVKFGESFFFPTKMKSIKNLCNGDDVYFMEHYMRRILEGKPLVAHNMEFDWRVAYIYDINANIIHDTRTIFELTYGNEYMNFSCALKPLTKQFLHRDALELSDLVVEDEWGASDIRFWDLPYELVRYYACADTDDTNGLLQYALTHKLLEEYNALTVYKIEIAFSYAVAYQQFYGHKINVDNLDSLREEITAGIKANYEKMRDIVGFDFNPNSPKQLLEILYGSKDQGGLGIPVQISYKTNRPTTDAETIKKLAELTDENDETLYPFCKYLLKYRENEGVRKIIDQFPKLATPDGYLFSQVYQYGTTTGRVSIKEPNYQSYNNPVKKNIVPRPGFYMTDSDYSSVEYRVLGNMSGNTMIKEGFVDPDFDYHAYQAARMYGVPYAAVTKKLRKAAKGINFGLPYGMGDESLGSRIFGDRTQENTLKAAALRAKYFEGQEDIRQFFDEARSKGVERGYSETYFGRRRYYHRSVFSVGKIKRQAGNAVIQGSAADIYKMAVGRLFKRICREGWLGKVLLTGFIHDEVLCEIHESINPAIWLKALREEFEVKIKDWCPLYMGFGFGMSWYEAKSVEWSIKLQWEWVNNYGENGYPKWTNGYDLCADVPNILRDFSIRDISKQLLDVESQGKHIKPTLNNELIDTIKDDVSFYNKCLSGINIDNDDTLATVNEAIQGCFISSGVLTKEDGSYIMELSAPSETQAAIDLFCRLHNLDRSKIDILNIPDVTVKEKINTDIVSEDYNSYEPTLEDREKTIKSCLMNLGTFLDTDDNIFYVNFAGGVLLNSIKSYCREDKGYTLILRDFNKDITYKTKYFIDSEGVKAINDMYIQLKKMTG